MEPEHDRTLNKMYAALGWSLHAVLVEKKSTSVNELHLPMGVSKWLTWSLTHTNLAPNGAKIKT